MIPNLPGAATHYRPTSENVSACGVEFPSYSAYDPRDADCRRCRKTKSYRLQMEPTRGSNAPQPTGE